MTIRDKNFDQEFNFKTSRSGGKGGQHVNKTESKVELNWDINSSELISEEEKSRIKNKLANRITKEGILQIIVQTERSQLKNKNIAIDLFYTLVEDAMKEKKKRKKTKPSKAAAEKRIENKKRRSEIKKFRRTDFNF